MRRASTEKRLCFRHGSGVHIALIQIYASKLSIRAVRSQGSTWQTFAAESMGIRIPPGRNDGKAPDIQCNESIVIPA